MPSGEAYRVERSERLHGALLSSLTVSGGQQRAGVR